MYSKFGHIVALLLLLLMAGGNTYAQYKSIPFVVLNADGKNLTDKIGRAWDPEDGIWMPSSEQLSEMDDLEIFVTNEACADSIETWSKINSPRTNRLVNAFVTEYRNRGWLLHRKGETYDLEEVNVIAEEIYGQYGWIVDFWCRESGDPRGIYSVALLLHPKQSGKFETIVLSEKISEYDGENEICPIYYKNRVMLANVDKVHQVRTFHKTRKQAKSDGNWLTFDEHFNLEGPSSKRLIVEREIETCIFEKDYNTLDNRLDQKPHAQALNRQLMDHRGQFMDTTYILDPMVFAGERFMMTKDRQLRWDLRRDTLDYYRRQTQEIFDQSGRWVEYREVDPDTMTYQVPRPLWKLLLRYKSFEPLRNELLRADKALPSVVSEQDTTEAYTITTTTELYNRFAEYIKEGHRKADQTFVTSESELVDGYVTHINQMDIYPVRQEKRRVRIEHNLAEGHRSLPLNLAPYGSDTVLHYRWQMPDSRRFYQMRHINYLQDFVHADSTHVMECGCERQMPLQFIMVSSHPAGFDCPPRRHAATDEEVSFRPRERGEPIDATYQLALSFDFESTKLDLARDSNRTLLEQLVQKAYDITHDVIPQTIQRVSITGISSPEGVRSYNMKLSQGRSKALAKCLRDMGGEYLSHARFDIQPDSIVPWIEAAELIDQLHPEEHETAELIRQAVSNDLPENTLAQQRRIGYAKGNIPVIAEALDMLRKAQVRFTYKVLYETPVEEILSRYWSGEDRTRWTPYYYYVLFRAKELSRDEKLQLARQLLSLRQTQVRRFSRDLHPTDSYGLVLPMAANLLAEEALSEGRYDRQILAPFINEQIAQGNIACYMENDTDTPVKFINLDVVLYNQILMLCGIGTDEAMQEAYELVDMLETTQTLSPKFRQTYHPEWMELLINSHNGNFLEDAERAEEIKRTNINNLYVVNMAQIYQEVEGDVRNIMSNDVAQMLLTQCLDSLQSLRDQVQDQPAALYFTAVTQAWAAVSIGGSERDKLFDDAVKSLVALFDKRANPNYIERLQGDSYLREIYRNSNTSHEGRDLYLEAVERYILQMTHEVQ